jgi:hypothetical protein
MLSAGVDTGMMLPYARTFNEAILYIRLRPCRCGEMEARWQDVPVTVEGRPARYFTANCEQCGKWREFTIAMPADAAKRSDAVYGDGDEPSQVIDPGEWMDVLDLYGERADEVLADENFGTAEDVNLVYFALAARLSAADEILKFLPPGADVVPEWSFRSTTGRAVYEATPERFGRDALLAERAALQSTVDRFVKDINDRPG